jgi:hypothetical protein
MEYNLDAIIAFSSAQYEPCPTDDPQFSLHLPTQTQGCDTRFALRQGAALIDLLLPPTNRSRVAPSSSIASRAPRFELLRASIRTTTNRYESTSTVHTRRFTINVFPQTRWKEVHAG